MAKSAPAAPHPDAQRILDSLRVLVREIRISSTTAEQATGLSAAQLFVLRVLVREQGLSINDLAAQTLTHQSSVSVVVSKLESAGLIERRQAKDDARRVALHPTKTGNALAKRSPDPIQERLVASLNQLPATTRRQLANVLNQWVAVMGVSSSEPEMFFEAKRRG